MASINYAAREISVKIVYYGPGLSGKTTNLQIIHRKVPKDFKSDMVSLATETDRTLFFDFLPLNLGKIKGFTAKFQLYTVPGQVYYSVTRKLVLRGVDGVVFVADSAEDKMKENLESFQNLEDNLKEYGYKREEIPIIIQYNKRDLPNALSIEELNKRFNKYNLPTTEAVATAGKGIFETLKLIGKVVIDELNKKYAKKTRPAVKRPPQTTQTTAPETNQNTQESTAPKTQTIPTTPPPVFAPPSAQSQQFQQPSTPPPPPPQQAPVFENNGSNLDAEIEKYQRQMTQQNETFAPPPQQAGFANTQQTQFQQPQQFAQQQQFSQPQQPFTQPSSAPLEYKQPQSIYNTPPSSPSAPNQQQSYPSQGNNQSNSLDEFDEFEKPKKGFFGKLFGKR